MRLRFVLAVFTILFPLHCLAQVSYAYKESAWDRVNVGAGIDYWATDWSGQRKFGPSAWASTELWHGLGIQAEGHSLLAGGKLSKYKYAVGEGGVQYTYHRWQRYQPFIKAEMGYGGFSVASTKTNLAHYTMTTWSLGCGTEIHTWKHIWSRVEYTYDGFPNVYSSISDKYHTLNPNGITVGETYHFRFRRSP